MKTRIGGFKGEFLWELEIAERQLLALAEALPAERYGWCPEGARSVSEVLVHVAAGNFMLLAVAGISAAPDVYGQVEGETPQRMFLIDSKNQELERVSPSAPKSSRFSSDHWKRCGSRLQSPPKKNWNAVKCFSLNKPPCDASISAR